MRTGERDEIPVEALTFVAGHPGDRVLDARRWIAAAQHGARVALDRAAPVGGPAPPVPVVVTSRGSMFRRLVDVPAARLGSAVGAWWADAGHDDGHLRLDLLQPCDDSFALAGSFRATRLSRRLPIDLRLSPYAGAWSLLELTPRRSTKPTRSYFRAGNDSIDRLVAALSALV